MANRTPAGTQFTYYCETSQIVSGDPFQNDCISKNEIIDSTFYQNLYNRLQTIKNYGIGDFNTTNNAVKQFPDTSQIQYLTNLQNDYKITKEDYDKIWSSLEANYSENRLLYQKNVLISMVAADENTSWRRQGNVTLSIYKRSSDGHFIIRFEFSTIEGENNDSFISDGVYSTVQFAEYLMPLTNLPQTQAQVTALETKIRDKNLSGTGIAQLLPWGSYAISKRYTTSVAGSEKPLQYIEKDITQLKWEGKMMGFFNYGISKTGVSAPVIDRSANSNNNQLFTFYIPLLSQINIQKTEINENTTKISSSLINNIKAAILNYRVYLGRLTNKRDNCCSNYIGYDSSATGNNSGCNIYIAHGSSDDGNFTTIK